MSLTFILSPDLQLNRQHMAERVAAIPPLSHHVTTATDDLPGVRSRQLNGSTGLECRSEPVTGVSWYRQGLFSPALFVCFSSRWYMACSAV